MKATFIGGKYHGKRELIEDFERTLERGGDVYDCIIHPNTTDAAVYIESNSRSGRDMFISEELFQTGQKYQILHDAITNVFGVLEPYEQSSPVISNALDEMRLAGTKIMQVGK